MIFMVLSSLLRAIQWEFTRFTWWKQTRCQTAANPQTKPVDLGCDSEPACWLLPCTSTLAFLLLLNPESWYSFYRSTWSERMSPPRHCSKSVQPVPKAVYHTGCRGKHNCRKSRFKPDSDALTTRPLRRAKLWIVHIDCIRCCICRCDASSFSSVRLWCLSEWVAFSWFLSFISFCKDRVSSLVSWNKINWINGIAVILLNCSSVIRDCHGGHI